MPLETSTAVLRRVLSKQALLEMNQPRVPELACSRLRQAAISASKRRKPMSFCASKTHSHSSASKFFTAKATGTASG